MKAIKGTGVFMPFEVEKEVLINTSVTQVDFF